MAEFKEELVINALHTDKAEIGKKYWFSDSILRLKEIVEEDATEFISILTQINTNEFHSFSINECDWEFIYPYEEPPKKRMTNRMLSEWCAKGNGEFTWKNDTQSYTEYPYAIKLANEYVDETIIIRTWDSEEWQDPLYSIYKRDVFGEKED